MTSGTITVVRGVQCNIHLAVNNPSGTLINIQNTTESATLTFTVTSTSISKGTSNWTIFPAYYLYEDVYQSGWWDERNYEYLIRILPADTTGLSGNYTYHLAVTTTTYGTQNFTGTFTVVVPAAGPNFSVNNGGTPALIYLETLVSGNNTAEPAANITFNVANISKSTANSSIFYRVPTLDPASTDPYGHVIRLYPGELASLAAGSYTYSLIVTTATYGTKAYYGTMTVTGGTNVSVTAATASLSFSANTAKAAVNAPGVAATTSFNANAPTISPVATAATAILNFNANPAGTSVENGDVTVTTVPAVLQFNANPASTTSTPGTPVTVTAATATASFNANVGTAVADPPPQTFFSKVGQFNTPTAVGSQTVTGVGFTPKVVIFWEAPGASTGWSISSLFGIGFAANNNGTMQVGYITIADGSGQDNSQRDKWSSTSSIGCVNYNSTMINEGVVTAFNSNGFVINWTTATAALPIHYLALGGTAITNAAVISWTANSTTGNQSVTTVGFTPTSVITIGDASTAASGSLAADGRYHIGAMDGTSQWAMFGYTSLTVPTSTGRLQLTDSCIVGRSTLAVGTPSYKASYVAMLSNGFQINWSAADGNARKFVSLCLQGTVCQVGSWTKSTAAAPATDTIGGLNLIPFAVLAATDSYPASASMQTGHRLMIGASDGTNFGVTGVTDKHNVYPSVAYKFTSPTAALNISDNDTETSDAVGTLTFSGANVLANWSTNNAVATQMLYLVFGMLGAKFTQTTVPNLTGTVYLPSVTVQNNAFFWNQTVVPNAGGAAIAPSVGIEVDPLPPDATGAAIAPDIDVKNQYVVWNQEVVPDATGEAIAPVVVLAGRKNLAAVPPTTMLTGQLSDDVTLAGESESTETLEGAEKDDVTLEKKEEK
jgi:hypothetical protein